MTGPVSGLRCRRCFCWARGWWCSATVDAVCASTVVLNGHKALCPVTQQTERATVDRILELRPCLRYGLRYRPVEEGSDGTLLTLNTRNFPVQRTSVHSIPIEMLHTYRTTVCPIKNNRSTADPIRILVVAYHVPVPVIQHYLL